jgi:transposase
LPSGTIVLAQDETDLLLFPPLRAGWARRATPMPVSLSGRNARRIVFGALNLRTGHRVLLASYRQRAVDFSAFLRELRRRYRSQPLVLLLDEDSSHTAGTSQRLADALAIELLWLPKRCPELNPMEHLWRDAKQRVCANRQYATIDIQLERFLRYINGIGARATLRKAGLLSKGSWLASALSNYLCRPT